MIWGTNARRGLNKRAGVSGRLCRNGSLEKNTVFQDIASLTDNQVTLTGAGNPQFLSGYNFSANYFSILGVSPQLGRTFTAEEDRPGAPKVVVLSDKLWRGTFLADPAILGKTVTLDGEPYRVIGVMPRTLDSFKPGVQLWMLICARPTPR